MTLGAAVCRHTGTMRVVFGVAQNSFEFLPNFVILAHAPEVRKLVSASGGSKMGAAGQLERRWNERELTNIGHTKQT